MNCTSFDNSEPIGKQGKFVKNDTWTDLYNFFRDNHELIK